MAELVMLSPHDALPGGRVVTVMQRFDEDDPDRVIVEIALTGEHGRRETTVRHRRTGRKDIVRRRQRRGRLAARRNTVLAAGPARWPDPGARFTFGRDYPRSTANHRREACPRRVGAFRKTTPDRSGGPCRRRIARHPARSAGKTVLFGVSHLIEVHHSRRRTGHPRTRLELRACGPDGPGTVTTAQARHLGMTLFTAERVGTTKIFRAAAISCRAHSAVHLPVVRNVAVLTTECNTFRRAKITNCSMPEEGPQRSALRPYVYCLPARNTANPRRNLRMGVSRDTAHEDSS